MNKSSCPGCSDLTMAQMSDRLAALNMFGAYTYFANIGDLQGWAGQFHPDVGFNVSAPGAPGRMLLLDTVIAAEEPQFAAYRAMYADPTLGEAKFYQFCVPYLYGESGAGVDVSTNLVQIRTHPDGPDPRIQLTATYDGSLLNTDGVLKIVRWTIVSSRQPESVSETPAIWWLHATEEVPGGAGRPE